MVRLENVLKISLQDVLKTLWRRLEDVLKTSWRRLEDVLKTYGQDEYIGLDQDVFWRRKAKANIFVLIKASSEDEIRLQDVFIKTNVCWVVIMKRLYLKRKIYYYIRLYRPFIGFLYRPAQSYGKTLDWGAEWRS